MSNTAKAGAVIDAAKIAYDSYQKCKNTDAASCAQATAETIGCAAASGFVPLLGGLYCQAFIDYAKGGPFPALDLALVAAQNNIDAVIQIAADGYNAIVQKTPEVEWVASMAAESIPQNIENCFPSDALVQTPDNGAKRMDQLRIGDKVLAVGADGSTFYDDIYMFGHKDADFISNFIKLETSSGATMRLTPDHFVPVVRNGKRALVPSNGAQVGDLLTVIASGQSVFEAIVSKTISKEEGLWNPYTTSGSIVVDGVQGSCHSAWSLDGLFKAMGIHAATGYQTAFAPIRAVYRMIGAERMLRIEFFIDAVATAGCRRQLGSYAAAIGAAAGVAMFGAKRIAH